jgi:hypothetical protein
MRHFLTTELLVMTSLLGRSAIAVLLAFVTLQSARAEGIIDYVPAEATGFVVVRNLGATDAKIQKLMDIFGELSDEKPPAPLAFIKTATGLGAGINEAGDALLAALPGDASPLQIKPLLIVAVSDYAKFAESVGGDASGEISRVTIVGNEVLAAKRGDYAVLMNVEHRPTMEVLLAAEPKVSPTAETLGDWLGANDLSLVLLPAGVDALTAMGNSAIDSEVALREQQYSGTEMADELAQAKREMELFRMILGFWDAEISAGGIGAAIDDDSNVQVSDRVVFADGGRLASAADVAKPARAILAGYPDRPFVFAGGGPIPPEWIDGMASMSRSFMEQAKDLYGFEDFDDAKWKELENSYREAMQLRSMSMIMFAGEKDDPLYSNVYGVVDMEDSSRYIESTKKSMTTWNELTADSSSDIKLSYEMSEVEIAGKKGLLVENDILAAAGDDDVPMVKPMMEAMFGSDGKMRFFLVPADADTVVMAIASEGDAAAAVEAASSEASGLADAEHVKTTQAMLNPAAPWTGYVSPQGCVIWGQRMLATMMAMVGGGPAVTIPEYPAGPPVGFSMNVTAGQLQGEAVVPAQTLKDLAAYIKKTQE